MVGQAKSGDEKARNKATQKRSYLQRCCKEDRKSKGERGGTAKKVVAQSVPLTFQNYITALIGLISNCCNVINELID